MTTERNPCASDGTRFGNADVTIRDLDFAPQPATPDDLRGAAAYLETWEFDPDDPDTGALAHSLTNAREFLLASARRIERRNAITAAKRAYAAEHGIPISQVRIAR